jgi:hypothetical protein
MFFPWPWRSKRRETPFHDTQLLALDHLVDEFHDAMADIRDPARTRLHAALIACQSPRDLWFLRGRLFSLIARHLCEREAHERLGRLDHKLRFFVTHHPDHSPDELPSGALASQH